MQFMTANECAAIGGGISPLQAHVDHRIVAMPEPGPGMPYPGPMLDLS